ncbi:hypothetical protein F5Y11DRAFT_328070 [Daldinia sp. FL1419]|nr:hypothetical protein F5Y11DRAFT_328070 [Daldinia sp. FL1419]
MVPITLLRIVAISSFGVAFARPPTGLPKSLFPNITAALDAGVDCFPFEDPHCCVDQAVCQCTNGTFFGVNVIGSNDSSSALCLPPSNVTYGQDMGNIPGYCC